MSKKAKRPKADGRNACMLVSLMGRVRGYAANARFARAGDGWDLFASVQVDKTEVTGSWKLHADDKPCWSVAMRFMVSLVPSGSRAPNDIKEGNDDLIPFEQPRARGRA